MKVTAQQIAQLRDLLQSGADADLFFSSIKSPDWIGPLLENGFFDSPPKAERGESWVRFPAWPQSRYLVRVADHAPELAVKAALSIPQTDNGRVNNDVLKVALAVPPASAARLLPRIEEALLSTALRGAASDAGEVIARLAHTVPAEARELLRRLISFTPDPDKAQKEMQREAGVLVGSSLNPKARFNEHDYQELLAAAVPPLLAAQPWETLEMLADAVNAYIWEKMGNAAGSGRDGSLYWRPSIAEHEQNSDHQEVTYLISAVRQAGEDLVKGGIVTTAQLSKLAHRYRWDLFKRLEMHWARQLQSQFDANVIRNLLLDPAHFFSSEYDLEYGLLLRAVFPTLAPEDQLQIFQWTEQGPDEEDLAWMRRDFNGETVPPDVLARRTAYWRVCRLFWIKEALPSAMRARYYEWVSASSEPEHPGFHVWTGPVEMGVRSPTTAENFSARSMAEQADYLRTWEPEGSGWNGPAREGLAGVLQASVKSRPEPYLAELERFLNVEPLYAAAILRGLGEGLKGIPVSHLPSLWKFARWLLAQPDPQTEITDEFTNRVSSGRRWQSARLELARLLDALLRGAAKTLPATERTAIWPLLAELAHDPDPNAADEARDRENNRDPFTHSLNSVRGEAVHATFSYISWLRRSGGEATPGQEFDDLPEVGTEFARLLDPQQEPAEAIRSIFGVNVGRLAFWAESWFMRNLPQIFPSDSHRELYQAAWEGYIHFSRANSKMLALLREQYRTAVESMSQMDNVGSRHNDVRIKLGEHLVVNYWWGKLDFTQPDDLLARFFQRAPRPVRAAVLAFVGRSVAQAEGAIPPEIHDRLVRFWKWRVAVAIGPDGKGHRAELAEFAWWFDSEKFEDAWAIRQMVLALELSHSVADQSLWMKRFAALADRFTADAVRGLELTVQAAQERGESFWEDEEALAIFQVVAKISQPNILERARRAQNILLGMGKSQYLHALPLIDAT